MTQDATERVDHQWARAQLMLRWATLLPEHPHLGEDLLARWSQAHRRYHDVGHLAYVEDALDQLEGSPLEHLALWFHDAVHHNRPGEDEQASATLARRWLTGAGIDPGTVEEVARLVLVTLDHSPAPDDMSGCRVSDADLAILGASPARYEQSLVELRAEFPAFTDLEWQQNQRSGAHAFLARARLFHSARGYDLWEAAARENLAKEFII